MKRIKNEINRIYTAKCAAYYDSFCRNIDALSDGELDTVCRYFAESPEYIDIESEISDLESLAAILGVEVEDIENR